MDTYNSSMAAHFRQLLEQRMAELREIVRASSGIGDQDREVVQGEISDFKDVASEQSQVAVSEAQADRAMLELEQLKAALQRLDMHNFGHCLDCGNAINLRRLAAMPSAAFCTACQAIHESHAVHAVRP